MNYGENITTHNFSELCVFKEIGYNLIHPYIIITI
jgi:hypothetical protein